MSVWLLNISKDEDSTTSLGKLLPFSEEMCPNMQTRSARSSSFNSPLGKNFQQDEEQRTNEQAAAHLAPFPDRSGTSKTLLLGFSLQQLSFVPVKFLGFLLLRYDSCKSMSSLVILHVSGGCWDHSSCSHPPLTLGVLILGVWLSACFGWLQKQQLVYGH